MLEKQEAPAAVKEVLLEAERKLNDIRDLASEKPYALVLIDGDGYLFHPTFLREGFPGGEKAGQSLHKKVHDYFNDSKFKGQRGWQIVIRIFANVDGLATAMKRIGRMYEAAFCRRLWQELTRVMLRLIF